MRYYNYLIGDFYFLKCRCVAEMFTTELQFCLYQKDSAISYHHKSLSKPWSLQEKITSPKLTTKHSDIPSLSERTCRALPQEKETKTKSHILSVNMCMQLCTYCIHSNMNNICKLQFGAHGECIHQQ